jgi:hypothetical protein
VSAALFSTSFLFRLDIREPTPKIIDGIPRRLAAPIQAQRRFSGVESAPHVCFDGG